MHPEKNSHIKRNILTLMPDYPFRFGMYGSPIIARGFSTPGEYSSQHENSLSSSPLITRVSFYVRFYCNS